MLIKYKNKYKIYLQKELYLKNITRIYFKFYQKRPKNS